MKFYDLLDNAKCYERIRELRWPDGVICPRCKTDDITRQGKDESQPERQRYFCKSCSRKFDDLTLSVFAVTTTTENVGQLFAPDVTQYIKQPDRSRA